MPAARDPITRKRTRASRTRARKPGPPIGVLAPGARYNRTTGKVTAPTKAPSIFGPLPKATKPRASKAPSQGWGGGKVRSPPARAFERQRQQGSRSVAHLVGQTPGVQARRRATTEALKRDVLLSLREPTGKDPRTKAEKAYYEKLSPYERALQDRHRVGKSLLETLKAAKGVEGKTFRKHVDEVGNPYEAAVRTRQELEPRVVRNITSGDRNAMRSGLAMGRDLGLLTGGEGYAGRRLRKQVEAEAKRQADEKRKPGVGGLVHGLSKTGEVIDKGLDVAAGTLASLDERIPKISLGGVSLTGTAEAGTIQAQQQKEERKIRKTLLHEAGYLVGPGKYLIIPALASAALQPKATYDALTDSTAGKAGIGLAGFALGGRGARYAVRGAARGAGAKPTLKLGPKGTLKAERAASQLRGELGKRRQRAQKVYAATERNRGNVFRSGGGTGREPMSVAYSRPGSGNLITMGLQKGSDKIRLARANKIRQRAAEVDAYIQRGGLTEAKEAAFIAERKDLIRQADIADPRVISPGVLGKFPRYKADVRRPAAASQKSQTQRRAARTELDREFNRIMRKWAGTTGQGRTAVRGGGRKLTAEQEKHVASILQVLPDNATGADMRVAIKQVVELRKRTISQRRAEGKLQDPDQFAALVRDRQSLEALLDAPDSELAKLARVAEGITKEGRPIQAVTETAQAATGVTAEEQFASRFVPGAQAQFGERLRIRPEGKRTVPTDQALAAQERLGEFDTLLGDLARGTATAKRTATAAKGEIRGLGRMPKRSERFQAEKGLYADVAQRRAEVKALETKLKYPKRSAKYREARSKLSTAESRLERQRRALGGGAQPLGARPKMPGYPAVEMVPTSRLAGMAGNDLTASIVRRKRGKPITDPVIVDYDERTGLARVVEGNHTLAAAVAEGDAKVPVQVMRGTVKEGQQGARRLTDPDAPDPGGIVFPSDVGLLKQLRREPRPPALADPRALEKAMDRYAVTTGRTARQRLRSQINEARGMPRNAGLKDLTTSLTKRQRAGELKRTRAEALDLVRGNREASRLIRKHAAPLNHLTGRTRKVMFDLNGKPIADHEIEALISRLDPVVAAKFGINPAEIKRISDPLWIRQVYQAHNESSSFYMGWQRNATAGEGRSGLAFALGGLDEGVGDIVASVQRGATREAAGREMLNLVQQYAYGVPTSYRTMGDLQSAIAKLNESYDFGLVAVHANAVKRLGREVEEATLGFHTGAPDIGTLGNISSLFKDARVTGETFQPGQQVVIFPKGVYDTLEGVAGAGVPGGLATNRLVQYLTAANSMFRRTVLPLTGTYYVGNFAENWGRIMLEGLSNPATALQGTRVYLSIAKRARAGDEDAAAMLIRQRANLRYQSATTTHVSSEVERAAMDLPKIGLALRSWEHIVDFLNKGNQWASESLPVRGATGIALLRSARLMATEQRATGMSVAKALEKMAANPHDPRIAHYLDDAYAHVHRTMGRYDAAGPAERAAIRLMLPFLDWARNSFVFMAYTMPVEHPAVFGTMVSLVSAMEEVNADEVQRQKDFEGEGEFKRGSVEIGGRDWDIGRYFPTALAKEGPGELLGSLGGPFQSPLLALLAGTDWKGSKLRKESGGELSPWERIPAAGASLTEATVPGLRQLLTRIRGGRKAASPLTPWKAISDEKFASQGYKDLTGYEKFATTWGLPKPIREKDSTKAADLGLEDTLKRLSRKPRRKEKSLEEILAGMK